MLTEKGLMTQAGLQAITQAKQDGSWTILDSAEALEIPDDLAIAFAKVPIAQAYFATLSRTDKRNILQWLVLAKQPSTRERRVTEIVSEAAIGTKPKQFR